ncbi:DMT family transporter [Methanocaldococcus vulcanius]|nr:DMT family transporter [Methanocaldococcus vulcanius]
MINYIVDFFASYGLFGLISYIVLVYSGWFWLGIELKKREIFEGQAFTVLIYIFLLGISWEIADEIAGKIFIEYVIASGIVYGITLGIAWWIIRGEYRKITWWIAGGFMLEIAWWITYYTNYYNVEITDMIEFVIAEMAIFAIAFWILRMISHRIARVIAFGIALGIIGKIMSEIVGWGTGFVWYITGGFVGGITFEIASIIADKIAKSEYNKSLENLKREDYSNCLKHLNGSLYLLRDYSNKEIPYHNKDLAYEIISLKDNLEQIQIANEYYNSGNYKEALKTYIKINENASKNENKDLKEIIKDKIENTESKLKNQFKEQLQKADDLFNKNKIEEALNEYKKLLNEYPMFENETKHKIKKCKKKLEDERIRQLESEFKNQLQKADELFKNNEIEEAMDEYEKLLNLLSGKYQKISYKYEKVLNDKIQKCEEILKNPPLELLLERAKRYSSEALILFNQNKLSKAIEKWKGAVKQYERAKEIAKLKEDKEIVKLVDKNIKVIISNIFKTGIKLINDKLTNI